MALPSEYFNNDIAVPSDDSFLASVPDIIKEINLDNINLEDFLKDKSSETLPGLTITPAPKAQTSTQNTPEAPLQQKQAPSKEESDKLDELEKISTGLEEKINELNSSEKEPSTDPTRLTAEQLLEQKLNEPLGDGTDQVEIAQPQNFNNFETKNCDICDKNCGYCWLWSEHKRSFFNRSFEIFKKSAEKWIILLCLIITLRMKHGFPK